MRLPNVSIAALAIGTIVACGPANAASTFAGPANDSPSLTQHARTSPAVGVEDGNSNHALAPLGTVSISLRGGAQTFALVVPRSGDQLPWSQFTEIPYVAKGTDPTGNAPVQVKEFFRDGMWGTVTATRGANHRVAIEIDLEDRRLLKMDHSTFATLGTIDRPEWQGLKLHQTIDLGDGQTVPLLVSGKTIGTVSWASM
ncbi:MAG: hypothetical protein ABF479_00275 [Gluconacetobacter sp.]